MTISYYSPNVKDKIFNKKSINIMIKIWNINNKNNKINTINYKNLNNKLKNILGDNKYWLWTTYLYHLTKTSNKMRIKLKLIEKRELIPEKPLSWLKNKKEWLSNYDINNVMIQYSLTPKYKYSFLGVFPIDFSIKYADGTCAYNKFCSINIKKYINKKKNFIGFITNLDKHDEPGSHWTSSFIVINPLLKTYGAYYYDSTGSTIPSYLLKVFNDIKLQMDKIYKNTKFNIIYNTKQQQFKNSECGMFSIVYQLRWINKHIVKKNNTSFKEILGNPFIKDENMNMLRDILFRPNSKLELKKLKIL